MSNSCRGLQCCCWQSEAALALVWVIRTTNSTENEAQHKSLCVSGSHTCCVWMFLVWLHQFLHFRASRWGAVFVTPLLGLSQSTTSLKAGMSSQPSREGSHDSVMLRHGNYRRRGCLFMFSGFSCVSLDLTLVSVKVSKQWYATFSGHIGTWFL